MSCLSPLSFLLSPPPLPLSLSPFHSASGVTRYLCRSTQITKSSFLLPLLPLLSPSPSLSFLPTPQAIHSCAPLHHLHTTTRTNTTIKGHLHRARAGFGQNRSASDSWALLKSGGDLGVGESDRTDHLSPAELVHFSESWNYIRASALFMS
jgi:hypothetical protein